MKKTKFKWTDERKVRGGEGNYRCMPFNDNRHDNISRSNRAEYFDTHVFRFSLIKPVDGEVDIARTKSKVKKAFNEHFGRTKKYTLVSANNGNIEYDIYAILPQCPPEAKVIELYDLLNS